MQKTQETRVRFLGLEDPLDEEMATHSSILPWKVSWTEDPGELQSMGLQRIRHNWTTDHTHPHRTVEYDKCIHQLTRAKMGFLVNGTETGHSLRKR